MFNHPDFYSYGMASHDSFMSFGPIIPLIALVALLALVLKAYCLWHAAQRGEKWWFIALFIINSLGILEIIYIIWVLKHFSSNKKTVVVERHDKVEEVVIRKEEDTNL